MASIQDLIIFELSHDETHLIALMQARKDHGKNKYGSELYKDSENVSPRMAAINKLADAVVYLRQEIEQHGGEKPIPLLYAYASTLHQLKLLLALGEKR